VKSAIDVGYRAFDCAWGYDNEAEVGRAIAEKIAEGVVKREDICITSKLHSIHHAKEHVRPYCLETLKNLNTSYVDLYLIHWPMGQKFVLRNDMPPNKWPIPLDANGKVLRSDVHFTETWRAMEELVKDGLVRRLGLSNFNHSQIEEILNIATVKPSVLQVEAHPFLQQRKLNAYCKEKGILLTAFCPIYFAKPELFEHPTMLKLIHKHNKTPSQICGRFLVQEGMSLIPKSLKPERQRENLDIFSFALDQNDIEELRKLDAGKRLCPTTEELDHPLYPFHLEY
jgi:aldehyde reductase